MKNLSHTGHNIQKMQLNIKLAFMDEPLRSDACFTKDDLEIPSMKLGPLALVEAFVELAQASAIGTS